MTATRRAGAALGVAAIAGGAAACQIITGGEACTTEARPALAVAVRDAGTGVAVADARVVARDGAYADTARGGYPTADGAVYSLAHEREGTYVVRVEAAGYQAFERAGVRVTADQCHVSTATLAAPLRR